MLADLGAVGFEFGEPGQGAGPERDHGRRAGVEVSQVLDFACVRVLCCVDLLEPLAEFGGLFVTLGLLAPSQLGGVGVADDLRAVNCDAAFWLGTS